jgi:DNA-binding transcriptional LysR family regulator
MTIRHLQIFLSVCRLGSITAAADELNMTQPAVSIAIKELESYYSARLFDRMNRRIYLTDAGITLRRYAEAVLGEFDEAEKVLRAGAGAGRCSVGANVSVGDTLLPDMLRAIEKGVPGVELDISVGNTRAMEKKLADNEMDFAVLDSPSGSANQAEIPLYRQEMAVVCAAGLTAGSRMTVRSLSKERLLLRESGSGSRACVDAVFGMKGCAVRPRAESASDLSLLRLAEGGLGITILPRGIAADLLKSGKLREIRISDGAFRRHYFIVYNKKRYMTEPVKRAVEILASWAENLPEEKSGYSAGERKRR